MASKTKSKEVLERRAMAEGVNLAGDDPAIDEKDIPLVEKKRLVEKERLIEQFVDEEYLKENTEEIPEQVENERQKEENNPMIALPIVNEYINIYSFMRTLGRMASVEAGVLTVDQFDIEVSDYLKAGAEIVDVLPAGFSTDGDRILFMFGHRADGKPGKYTEAHLIKRVVGWGLGYETGTNVDGWLNLQIEVKGWKLFKAMINGTFPEGLNMIYVMVR